MDVARPGVPIRGAESSSTQGSSSSSNRSSNRKLAMDGGGAAGPKRDFLCGVENSRELVAPPIENTSASLYPMPPSRCSALCPLLAARPSSPAPVLRGRCPAVSSSGRGIGEGDTGDLKTLLLEEEPPLERSPPRLSGDAGGPKPGEPGGRLFGSPARLRRICLAAALTLDPPRPNPMSAMSAPRRSSASQAVARALPWILGILEAALAADLITALNFT